MDFSRVIEYVEKVLRAEMGVPGCDLKVMRGHETLLRYSSGKADYEGKVSVSDKDVYILYSCTKPMTCTAAMQLVERGVIGLDDPVSKYLPEFANAFLMQDDKPVKPKNTMTIRHLFTMSAGLDYNRTTQPIQDVIAANPHAGTVDIVNALVRMPLRFEPGERFAYSMCHDVLGAVIEVASGMRLSQYMKQNIWEPLGMKNIGYYVSTSKPEGLAALYTCTGPKKCEPFEDWFDFNITDNYESGGAGLYSTVDAYSLFTDAMACGGVGATGARILKPETIDLMRKAQRTYEDMGGIAGAGYSYGLGVRTLTDKSNGQRSPLGEFGWDGAAGSYGLMDPENQVSIFYGMHVRDWRPLIGRGHEPIRDLVYEALGL
jgi:CubicO group peptidase (beta-lactamase class C family)